MSGGRVEGAVESVQIEPYAIEHNIDKDDKADGIEDDPDD